MTPVQQRARTMDGIVLLGWMERREAVKYLQEQCVFIPQLTEQQAEAIWMPYRGAVEALPERAAVMPRRFPLSPADAEAADKFRAKNSGPNILDVIRIDPLSLLVHQLYVVTEKSDQYASTITGEGWREQCLPPDRAPVDISVRGGADGYTADVPHGEFFFVPTGDGAFRILQAWGGVSTVCFGSGMMLRSGYHRTYAHTRIERDAADAQARSVLVALTTDVPPWVSPAAPYQGLRAALLGPRPPVFADFFDSRFFMQVKLRKKRYELQIRAAIAAIDA